MSTSLRETFFFFTTLYGLYSEFEKSKTKNAINNLFFSNYFLMKTA